MQLAVVARLELYSEKAVRRALAEGWGCRCIPVEMEHLLLGAIPREGEPENVIRGAFGGHYDIKMRRPASLLRSSSSRTSGHGRLPIAMSGSSRDGMDFLRVVAGTPAHASHDA